MARRAKLTLFKLARQLESKETKWPSVWRVPQEAPPKKLKRRPGYTPVSPSDLGESVLVTRFASWSGNRHPKKAVEDAAPQPEFAELRSNVYACVLASGSRTDRMSRGIFPKAMLTLIGITREDQFSSGDSSEQKSKAAYLVPLSAVPYQKVESPRVYVQCSHEIWAQLASSPKAYHKITGMMHSQGKSRPVPFNASQAKPPTNAISLVEDGLIDDMKQALTDALKTPGAASLVHQEGLHLTWRDDVSGFTDNGTVGVASVVGIDLAGELRKLVSEAMRTLHIDDLYISHGHATRVLLSLWRYQLYKL